MLGCALIFTVAKGPVVFFCFVLWGTSFAGITNYSQGLCFAAQVFAKL
jgi:hypothetical protein